MRLAGMVMVALLILAGCGKGSEERSRADEARAAQEDRGVAGKAEREAEELSKMVNALIDKQQELERQIAAAEAELAAAKTQAEREAAQAKIPELRRMQREAEARMTKVRAGVKLSCRPDDPLCNLPPQR